MAQDTKVQSMELHELVPLAISFGRIGLTSVPDYIFGPFLKSGDKLYHVLISMEVGLKRGDQMVQSATHHITGIVMDAFSYFPHDSYLCSIHNLALLHLLRPFLTDSMS
jgi:hypothetical protein